MNATLTQILADLNLQPGESQRVQVNGYHVEIRRPPEPEGDFARMVMLQPWAAFPGSGHAVKVAVRYQAHPLPVPPEIPTEENNA